MRASSLPRNGTATGLGLLFLHLGALAAFIPSTFTWTGLGVAIALCYLTGGLGISLGYHRLLTHHSLRLPRWLNYTIAVLGMLALQGGPITWVATHRRHHANADRAGDPHDIHRGLRWSHIEWLYRDNDARPSPDELRRLAPDLWQNSFYRFLERTNVLWQVVLGLALLAAGGWSFVIWGIFVRLVFTYHITWLVNSAAHHFGYRTYRTNDESRNNWWVALLTWGEGWHNNHHAFPSSARHGLRWFELDTTWLTIRVLAALRLAHDVRIPAARKLRRYQDAIAPRPRTRTAL
jgi:fatty-acid desaturase